MTEDAPNPTALTADLRVVGARPNQLSEEIRRIILGDPETSVNKGGAKACIELIEKEENPLKPGSLIYMIRDFKHAMLETGKEHLVNHASGFDSSTGTTIGTKFLDFMARKAIVMQGGFDRDFAYMHVAVYVGVEKGQHYIVENAGSSVDTPGEGKVLLRTIEASFADKEFEEENSSFFIVAPPGGYERTQQWALAAVGMPFKYHLVWVSCETFAQIVAGFFEDTDVKPMQQFRTLCKIKLKRTASVVTTMRNIGALFESRSAQLRTKYPKAPAEIVFDKRLVRFMEDLKEVFKKNESKITGCELSVSQLL